jgi:hypothetical protein
VTDRSRVDLSPLAAARGSPPRVDRRRVRLAAGLAALAGTGGLLLVRLLLNAPVSVGVDTTALYRAVSPLALLAPALGALAVGVTTDRPVVRVATLFAGVFGSLTAVASAAALPAAVVASAAVASVAVDGLDRPASLDGASRWLVAGGLVAGTACSLAASLGVDPASLRPLGSDLALLALAGTPAFVPWDRRAAGVGLLVGGVVVAAGVTAPFVTGAVALVGGAVVGASTPLLALAAAGTATTAATGLATRRPDVAVGSALLLAAGVPATVPRALAVVLGVTLLVTGVRR